MEMEMEREIEIDFGHICFFFLIDWLTDWSWKNKSNLQPGLRIHLKGETIHLKWKSNGLKNNCASLLVNAKESQLRDF